MSAQNPGLPGSDFWEFGTRRNLNDLVYEQAWLKVPVEATLASNMQAVGTAGPLYVGPRKRHTVTVEGTFSATLQVQGSTPGSVDFFPLVPAESFGGSASGASISAPGIYVFTVLIDRIQVSLTSYTSGSVTVRVLSEAE